MKKIGIYRVRTETNETGVGSTYDHFTICGYGFDDAVKNAKASGNICRGERIQDVTLLSEAKA